MKVIFSSLFFLLAIKILGAPAGLSFWFFQVLAGVFILPVIYSLSSRYIFWFLILVSSFFASESRFSIEYLIMAMGFFAWGAHPFWIKLSDRSRMVSMSLIFLGVFITTKLGIIFSEPGSFYFFVPAWLSLCFQGFLPLNYFAYGLSGFLLVISNKTSTLLAYIVSLLENFKSKFLLIGAAALLVLSFLVSDSLKHFIYKSFIPRLVIWKSSLVGFLNAPLFGHGFGTFPIDFPVFRSHGDVFGAKVHQHIVHGHSLFTHVLFEQGILGLVLLFILFYIIFKKARAAFLPALVVSFTDASLVSFSQYLIFGLIFLPLFLKENTNKSKLEILIEKLFSELPKRFRLFARISGYLLVITVIGTSSIGHYYYSKKNYDKAIKWDPKNSLYYFTRGARVLNQDTEASEKDLRRAIELSPSVSYFYGFLAASELANHKIEDAKINIKKALEYDGGDAYWYLLSSFINHEDKELSKEHYSKAIKKNPEIEDLLLSPEYKASEYIGSKKGDVRISSFYRNGPKIFLPLPYLERLPKFE